MRYGLLCCLFALGCRTQPFTLLDGGLDAGPAPAHDAGAMSRDLALPENPDLSMWCATDSNVTIDGTTPRGAFKGRYGWAFYTAADCPRTTNLHVQAGPFVLGEQNPYLVVSFPDAPKLGEQAVTVSLVEPMSGQVVMSAQGRANVTVSEPLSSTAAIRLEGTLKVNQSGYDLSGQFSVGPCAPLDIYCV
jgi:hypothetical protein